MVASHLRGGKGVHVPGLGNFTFSPVNIDLTGTTNQHERDKQERVPVFLISKEFCTAPLKSGIQVLQPNGSSVLRAFDTKSANGIIPSAKCNYIEVARYAGGLSKETCRAQCETLF